MVIVYLFIYILFYLIIYLPLNGKRNKKKNLKTELTEEEEAIIKLMGSGLSQKESGYQMGLTQSQANNVVKRIRKKTGYTSLMQIMFEYGAIYSK